MKKKLCSNLMIIICILSMLLISTNSHDVERHHKEMSTRVVPLYVQAYERLRKDIFDPLVNTTSQDESEDPKVIFLLFNRTICASIQMTEALEQARNNSLDIVNEVEESQFEIVRFLAEKVDEMRNYEKEIGTIQVAIGAIQPRIDQTKHNITDEEESSPECHNLENLRADLAKYQSDLQTQQDKKKALEDLINNYNKEKENVRQQYNEVQKQQNFTAVISNYAKQVAHHLQSLYTPSAELYSVGMMLYTFEPWLSPLNAIYEEMLRNKVMVELGFDLINETMIDEIKVNLAALNRTIRKLPDAVVAKEQCRLRGNGSFDADDSEETSQKNTTEDLNSEETESSTIVNSITDDETTDQIHSLGTDTSFHDLTTSSEFSSTLDVGNLSATSEPTLSANDTLNDTVSSSNEQPNSTAINTITDLDAIRNNPSGLYHLATDLNLFNSSFHSIPQFTGVFDGKGFSIINFTYIDDAEGDQTNAAGLFRVLTNSRIENVRMHNCIVNSNRTYVGCLIGHAINSTIERVGVISGEVTCTGDIISNSIWTCGGLIGRFSYTGRVNECFSNINVNGDQVYLTGGLVGGQLSSPDQPGELRILNSYSTGDVSGRWRVGGLSGGVINKSSSKIIINTSFSFGKVTAIGRLNEYGVGGLIGSADCIQTDAFYNQKLNSFERVQCGKGLGEKGYITLKNFRNYDAKIWNLTKSKHPVLKFEQIIPQPTTTTTTMESPTTMPETITSAVLPESQNSTVNQTSI